MKSPSGFGLLSGLPAAADTPPTIITSAPVRHWWRADLGVTLNAGAVSEWRDQVGTAHLAQASPTFQPLYNATDPTFSGLATITSDATNDGLFTGAVDFTGPVYILTVLKLISTAAVVGFFYGRGGFGGDGSLLQWSGGHVYQSGPAMNANTDFNATAIVGNWARFQDRRQNNAGDYIKIGNRAKVTGTACALSANPTAPFSITGTGNGPGTGNIACSYREIIVCAGEPTPTELTNIDAYFSAQSPMLQ